jgi:hypothetical protein
METSAQRWQWIDNTYGPQGWFTYEDMQKIKGEDGFTDTDGQWVKVPQKKVEEFYRWVGALAYQQA